MQQEKNQKQNLNLLQKSIRKREDSGMNVPPVRVVVGLVEKKFFTSLLLPKLFVATSAKVMATS